MNLIRRCKNLIKQLSGRPVMLYGYKVPNGPYLPNTRISNTTYIDSRNKLLLGDHVFIGHFNYIDSSNGIKIGEGCQLTNYISVLTHSSHIAIRTYGRSYLNTREHHGYKKGKVEIEPYCFIGPHSVIAPNTKIGKGSMVSAYSYVKGEFPPFSIISGNPAKVVGSTKDLDKKQLEEHPELTDHYNNWAEKE